MIVLKFGGTSLESSEAIERMGSIVQTRLHRRPVVVVSALGKVTDNLTALCADTVAGRRQLALDRFNWVVDYHFDVAGASATAADTETLNQFLKDCFSELRKLLDGVAGTVQLTPQVQAAVTSFGERLSSGIVTLVLRRWGIATAHLDSRLLVRTDDQHTQATPLLKTTYRNIRQAVSLLEEDVVPVLGGFIGSTLHGTTTVLGRNSSNLTAVLAAAALNAEAVEIWTDVDGVFPHDPSKVRDQYPVEELSFADALTLAHRGARILHYGAVLLAQQGNIPLWIKNSRKPKERGTRITTDASLCAAMVQRNSGQPSASSD